MYGKELTAAVADIQCLGRRNARGPWGLTVEHKTHLSLAMALTQALRARHATPAVGSYSDSFELGEYNAVTVLIMDTSYAVDSVWENELGSVI